MAATARQTAPAPAAPAAPAGAPHGGGIGDGQVLDGDVAGIGEQPAILTRAVQRVARAVDRQRDAGLEVQRIQIGRGEKGPTFKVDRLVELAAFGDGGGELDDVAAARRGIDAGDRLLEFPFDGDLDGVAYRPALSWRR